MPATDMITSAANPLVKQIRLLADRRHRRRAGMFVVEGVQPVWRAIEAGWEIETLLVVAELLPDSAAGLVAAQESLGVRTAWLSAELAGRISERDRPPGLFAIVRERTAALPSLPVTPDAVFLALHGVGNPGNLGTILRTCDAAGAAGVILVGDTADQFAPAAVKASMGSLFATPVARVADLAGLSSWAGEHGVRLLATSGYADLAHWSVQYPKPCLILLGNEGAGLPEDVLASAELQIRIPMVGTAESLNLAVAAALMLYEARRELIGDGTGSNSPLSAGSGCTDGFGAG